MLNRMHQKQAIAAGVDLPRLLKLQEQDRVAAEKAQAIRIKRIKREVEREAKRRRPMALKARQMLLRELPRLPFPSESVSLVCRADRIQDSEFRQGATEVIGERRIKAFADNSYKAMLRAKNSAAYCWKVVHIDFSWQNGLRGVLSARAFFDVHGTYSLITDPVSSGTPAARAVVQVSGELTRYSGTGSRISVATPHETILSEEITGGPSAVTKAGAIETGYQRYLHLGPLVVLPRDTLVGSIRYVLMAEARSHGFAELDLSSRSGFGARARGLIVFVRMFAIESSPIDW